MQDTLLEIEMALRSAERSLASALRRLSALKTTCARCGEPLDNGESGLCTWCFEADRVRELGGAP